MAARPSSSSSSSSSSPSSPSSRLTAQLPPEQTSADSASSDAARQRRWRVERRIRQLRRAIPARQSGDQGQAGQCRCRWVQGEAPGASGEQTAGDGGTGAGSDTGTRFGRGAGSESMPDLLTMSPVSRRRWPAWKTPWVTARPQVAPPAQGRRAPARKAHQQGTASRLAGQAAAQAEPGHPGGGDAGAGQHQYGQPEPAAVQVVP